MPTNNKGLKELWGYPLIDEKARNAISDTRSSLENDFQKKTDDTLGTTDKTVPGAINEIKNNIDNIGDNFTSEQSDTKYDMKYKGKSIGSIGMELTEDKIIGEGGSFNIDLTPYQTKTDTSLTTTDKTISGAIKELNTQYKDIENTKADKTTTQNIQQQVNNLVLGAVGDGNNAEIVQARGTYTTLNDRLNAADNTKVEFDKLDRPCREILNSKLFTINFQDLKVYVNKKDNYIVGTNGYEQFDSAKLSDIDIPEDAIKESLYSQYTFWYDKTNKELKFTKSNKCPKDNSIVFGFFYHGKPFIPNIGDGISVIDKQGKEVITSFSDVTEYLNFSKNACVFNGKVNIDTKNKKVIFTDVTLIYTGSVYCDNLPFRNKEVSWAEWADPNVSVWVWFDSSNNEIVLLPKTSAKDIPKNYYLICTYYSGNILNCLYSSRIFLNGNNVYLNMLSSAPELSTYKLKNPLRTFVNGNTLEVNFQDLKVYVKTADSYYVTEYRYIQCAKADGSKLDDITIPEKALTEYVLYMLWFNPSNHTLNFTSTYDVPANGINFGLFYRGKPYLNNTGNGITVINKQGEVVPTCFEDIKNNVRSMSQVIFYTTDASMLIDFDFEKNTITATSQKSHWFIFESGGILPNVDTSYTLQATADKLNYCFKLYVRITDATPLIKPHNAELSRDEIKNYAFVCMFNKNSLYSPRFDAKCILINGKVPACINAPYKNSNYDWGNNRFVLPSDWYLVKNIPYTISATNFNMQQLKDNDDCLFEITLPTNTVQFEQTAQILIPYSFNHPFKTRLSGKYKYTNSILSQDINLHVADSSKVSKKNVKILCIGDSITHSNYPKHLKWHLEQMGITATMIGTVSNSHESYSYGISQYLQAEKGEGRGGWRLTDFVCNTPLKAGGYYINNDFPMMNPSTNTFDFSYYMQQQGFDGVDFVIINLGTNDISGYHYAGSVSSNAAYNTIRKVDLETEYLNPESEYYLGKLYKKIIDSIHAYNSNIKIAINPPMGAGDSTFIVNSMKWAEICHYEFKDTNNVYNLSSYISQGQLSSTNIEGNRNDFIQVDSKNETYRCNYTPSDVHYNGMGQLIHTLYPASWIVNMCL